MRRPQYPEVETEPIFERIARAADEAAEDVLHEDLLLRVTGTLPDELMDRSL